ncbi:alpha/beta fold hydrolase [Pseudooceanicola aestuarii]|uniref:alpha/beta fold hydrolase n=1 Tax=Pseudooceanicola aestuarii TaxID=2697319 RepID=UPI0013D55211|nr:alpha/beta hydrolase [Pseudooceanicola aestuarii]
MEYVLLPLVGLALLVVLGLLGYSYHWKRKAERLVPPRGAFVTISTGRVHYVDCGSGPAVVLIHGLGGNLGHFDCGVIDDLARDHRVIAIDRPGCGYSDRPDDTPASPRDQARLVFEIMDKLEIDTPLIVGHSLGGAVALAMAVENSDRLRGLVLLAPLTLPMDEVQEVFEGLQMRSDLLRRIVAWTLATPTAIRNPEAVEQDIFGPEEIPPSYTINGGALLSLRPSSFFTASRDLMAADEGMNDIMRGYAGLTLPVRILFGTQDRILDAAYHGSALVGRYPQMGLKLVDGGHMLPITQPRLTSDYIRTASQKMQGGLNVRRASPEVYR